MSACNDIWLADVAQSLDLLGPGDLGTTRAIVRSLGLDLAAMQPVTPPSLHASRRTSEPGDIRDTILTEAGSDPTAVETDIDGLTADKGPLETLEPIAVDVGSRLEDWRGATPLEPVTARHLEGVHDHKPLFTPGQGRAILAATVATWDPTGPVDLDRLVDRVARALPVQRLPRRRQASLVRGIQLLVDTGKGMEPFARDQQELTDELRRVVGKSRVAEFRFRDCPLRGAGDGPVWTWKSYHPPSPGTPVVVLTDLGIGGPRFLPERSRPREWRALAERLARRNSPLVAFVPYPASRWPGSKQLRSISFECFSIPGSRGCGLRNRPIQTTDSFKHRTRRCAERSISSLRNSGYVWFGNVFWQWRSCRRNNHRRSRNRRRCRCRCLRDRGRYRTRRSSGSEKSA